MHFGEDGHGDLRSTFCISSSYNILMAYALGPFDNCWSIAGTCCRSISFFTNLTKVVVLSWYAISTNLRELHIFPLAALGHCSYVQAKAWNCY
jgi:hypothetical protein